MQRTVACLRRVASPILSTAEMRRCVRTYLLGNARTSARNARSAAACSWSGSRVSSDTAGHQPQAERVLGAEVVLERGAEESLLPRPDFVPAPITSWIETVPFSRASNVACMKAPSPRVTIHRLGCRSSSSSKCCKRSNSAAGGLAQGEPLVPACRRPPPRRRCG